MWFLSLLGWLSLIFQICFVTVAVAAALFYIAELVEEYTVIAANIIKYLILGTFLAHLGIYLFEEFPFTLILCSLLASGVHFMLLKSFPVVELSSPYFILTIGFLVLNHILSFNHFSSVYYPFHDILTYFLCCQWLVPFAFFVSLSANDNVLPTVSESAHIRSDDNDVVSNYFKRKSKKYGLLSFFKFAQDSILPERIKKAY